MPEKGNWSEKDEIAIHALIVNLLNQSTMFQDIGTNTIMPSSFGITNSKEYTLGLFTGIVINLFANYWVGEHEAGLTKEESPILEKRSFLVCLTRYFFIFRPNSLMFGLFQESSIRKIYVRKNTYLCLKR